MMYYSATIIQMGGIHDKRLAIWMASIVAAFNFACTFIGMYLVRLSFSLSDLTLGYIKE